MTNIPGFPTACHWPPISISHEISVLPSFHVWSRSCVIILQKARSLIKLAAELSLNAINISNKIWENRNAHVGQISNKLLDYTKLTRKFSQNRDAKNFQFVIIYDCWSRPHLKTHHLSVACSYLNECSRVLLSCCDKKLWCWF